MNDKNEPAFPALPISRELNGELVYQAKGLTIRDYFAAKAMAVIMPSVVEILQKQSMSAEKTDQLKKGAAAACYGMADAMMEARK
jgi:hypothetical protein